MHYRGLALFIPLLLLVSLLFGCTDMTPQEKSLCYSLASKSYVTVPACDDTTTCFAKVDGLFKTNLGYEQEDQLYYFKNNLARSWMFYNLGAAEMKKVAAACKSKSVAALPEAINNARSYFEEAFHESDEAMKRSVLIVSLEEQVLTKEKIDAAQEEPLYDSLITLRQILSELNSGATNSGSYASYYLQKTSEYNKAAAGKGFDYLIEKESFWTEEFDFVNNKVLAYLGPSAQTYITPITSGLEKVLDRADTIIMKRESLNELSRLPTKEMMTLYSSLAGSDTSAMKRFSDLMNRTSQRYIAVVAEKKTLLEETKTLLARDELLLANIEGSQKYQHILQALLPAGAVQQFDAIKELRDTKSDYILLTATDAKERLPLGEAVAKLKNIKNRLITIQTALDIYSAESIERMHTFCVSAATSAKNTHTDSPALLQLQHEVLFYANKILNDKSAALDYCEIFVQKNNELNEGLIDYAALEAKKSDATKDCFEYLDTVFKQASLSELGQEFKQLKETTVTQENVLSFSDLCESIKNQVDAELQDAFAKDPVRTQFAAVKEKFTLLSSVAEALDKPAYGAFKKELAVLNTYFDTNNMVRLSEAHESVAASVQKLDTDITNQLSEDIVLFATTHAQVIIDTNEVPLTNNLYHYHAQLVLPNPFTTIAATISHPFDINANGVIAVDSCVARVLLQKPTSVTYSCLALGGTTVTVDGSEVLKTTEENTLVYTTNKKSLVARTITLATPAQYPKIGIVTDKSSNQMTALIDNEEVTFIDDGATITFYATNVTPDSKMLVLVYGDGLVSAACALDKSVILDIDTSRLTYHCTLRNLASQDLSATIFLPIHINSVVKSIRILDATGKQQEYENQFDTITLTHAAFSLHEEKTISLFLEVDDSYSYYLEEIRAAKEKLLPVEDSDLIAHANRLLQAIPSNTFLTEASEFIAMVTKRLTEREVNLSKERADALVQDSLQNQITQAQHYLELLSAHSLTDAHDSLNAVVTTAQSALDTKDTSEMNRALNTLLKLKFDINQDMRDYAAMAVKRMRAVKSDNARLKELLLEATTEEQIFERLSTTDPAGADAHFTKLLSLEKEFNDIFIGAGEETTPEVEALMDECNELIVKLRAELDLDEATLIAAKFIRPITGARLSALELRIASTPTETISSQEKLDSLKQVQAELSVALDSIKKQTIGAYNTAIDSRRPAAVLQQAKDFIDTNRYVAAFLILQNPGSGNFFETIPFAAFLPIVFLLVLAFLIKKSTEKNTKKSDEQKKVILEEWKD